jgi:predicted RNA-binding protein YlqC (UPF0109 family)
MKDLVEEIAKALVDSPDSVTVKEVQGERVTVLELRVAPDDIGKIIGKQGRTARCIRTILGAAGVTFGAVQSVDETASDAQFQNIGALVPFADGNGLTVSCPFHLDGEEKVAPQRAPCVGQHSEEVLEEAGYSRGEIGRLRSLGVLG